jgi:type II secretory pathway pseudopilin PulG
MTSAARNPEIPPAPFAKGGDGLLLKPFFALFPSAPLFPFPTLKKGGQGGFAPGFTLVEVIVTILMAAIMGAFFIQFMGTAMSKSTRAVENVREEAAAESIMEQIVADYVTEINKANPGAALATIRGRTYGTSQVSVNMGYITFSLAGAKQTTTLSRTLQVTVRPAQAPGNELVTLLTESRQAGPPASPPVAY